MKYIAKGSEPQSFTNWKITNNQSYTNLRNPIKSELKNSLLLEQGYICCYCESKITNSNSHIEHLDPQCNNNNNDLDFTNMLCSCQKQLSRGEPRHCGNSKANETININPLEKDCEEKFKFYFDGSIDAIDLSEQNDRHFKKLKKLKFSSNTQILTLSDFQYHWIAFCKKSTIEILQLDIKKLRDLRKNAIELFIIDSETLEPISEEESKIFAEAYLQQIDGRYNEFYTTIKYLFTV